MINERAPATVILRLPDVKTVVGLSRSTIYLRVADGSFPKPVNLGGRAVGWPAHEVAMVNAARIAGRSDADVRDLVRKLEAARRLDY
jgi:prophage regulatory protein